MKGQFIYVKVVDENGKIKRLLTPGVVSGDSDNLVTAQWGEGATLFYPILGDMTYIPDYYGQGQGAWTRIATKNGVPTKEVLGAGLNWKAVAPEPTPTIAVTKSPDSTSVIRDGTTVVVSSTPVHEVQPVFNNCLTPNTVFTQAEIDNLMNTKYKTRGNILVNDGVLRYNLDGTIMLDSSGNQLRLPYGIDVGLACGGTIKIAGKDFVVVVQIARGMYARWGNLIEASGFTPR